MKYELKNGKFLKDGHTMFKSEILNDLVNSGTLVKLNGLDLWQWQKECDKQRKKAKKWKGRAKTQEEELAAFCEDFEKENEALQAELDKIKEARKVFLDTIEPEQGSVGKLADALNEAIWEPKVGDLVMTTHQEWPKIGRVHEVLISGCVVEFEDYMMDYLYEQLKKL